MEKLKKIISAKVTHPRDVSESDEVMRLKFSDCSGDS
jgi:hypothetical protein